MQRLLYFFVLLFFTASSCSEEEPAPAAVQELPTPVLRIEAPATAQAGETVTVEVYFQVNGGCGQFGSFNVSASGKEQVIQLVARYKGELCTHDMPIRKASYTFRPAEPGTYTLKFRSTPPEEYITAVIDVKAL
jgi:hypothetical protein